MDQWHELQQLSLEAKATLWVAVIVPTVLLVISEVRQARTRRTDQVRQDERDCIAREERAERDRQERERRDREEQRQLIAKQAILTLTRTESHRPLGVGSTGRDRMLVGTLWNVGMADAGLVRVRAFLDNVELPHSGHWAQQQDIPVGYSLGIRFILPFKREEPGQEHVPRPDEQLGNSLVRIEVRFQDASEPERMLNLCYRFDRVESSGRWSPQQVAC